MPAPSSRDIRKPLLETFRDEVPHNFVGGDFLKLMAEAFGENLNELSSIDKNLFKNNINEAKVYLKNKGLLSQPSKSTYMITQKGLKILEDNPDFIDDEYFAEKVKEQTLPEIINATSKNDLIPVEAEEKEEETQEELGELEETVEEIETPADFSENEFDNAVEEFVESQEELITEPEEIQPETAQEEIEEPYENEEVYEENEEGENEEEEEDDDDDDSEPITLNNIGSSNNYSEDAESSRQNLDEVFDKYNSELAEEVLTKVSELPSDKFEVLVIDLLSKMGYFAFQTARYRNDNPGSELIHGVILDNNKPGTNPIYIQARKSSPSKTIGRSDMNDFAKALTEKGGTGIFATTANFSEQAQIVATDERIMLIDGERLAGLMIANNFCVNVEKIFEVKAIDLDSFSEYED